jgi:hypothetical protein
MEETMCKKINDMTSVAVLVSLPPTLPVSVYQTEIVKALNAIGNKHVAVSFSGEIDTIKVAVHRKTLAKCQLSEEARYALAMVEGADLQSNEDWLTTATPCRYAVGNLYCSLRAVVEARTGAWRR